MDRQFAREDLGDGIDAVLREVEANGSATITENGRPSVRVVAVDQADRAGEAVRARRFTQFHENWTADPSRTSPWTRAELYDH